MQIDDVEIHVGLLEDFDPFGQVLSYRLRVIFVADLTTTLSLRYVTDAQCGIESLAALVRRCKTSLPHVTRERGHLVLAVDRDRDRIPCPIGANWVVGLNSPHGLRRGNGSDGNDAE